jgi:hypothetical protein
MKDAPQSRTLYGLLLPVHISRYPGMGCFQSRGGQHMHDNEVHPHTPQAAVSPASQCPQFLLPGRPDSPAKEHVPPDSIDCDDRIFGRSYAGDSFYSLGIHNVLFFFRVLHSFSQMQIDSLILTILSIIILVCAFVWYVFSCICCSPKLATHSTHTHAHTLLTSRLRFHLLSLLSFCLLSLSSVCFAPCPPPPRRILLYFMCKLDLHDIPYGRECLWNTCRGCCGGFTSV